MKTVDTSKLDSEIAALQGEIDTRTNELSKLRTKLSQKQIERNSLVHNIHFGDIVRRNGKEYRVCTIEGRPSFSGHRPWLEGNPRKLDGSFGTSRRALYGDWEKVG